MRSLYLATTSNLAASAECRFQNSALLDLAARSIFTAYPYDLSMLERGVANRISSTAAADIKAVVYVYATMSKSTNQEANEEAER
jgi:hypothetical protein